MASAHDLYFTVGAFGTAGGAVAGGGGTSAVVVITGGTVVDVVVADAFGVVVGASTSFWIVVVVVGVGFASSLLPHAARRNAAGMASATSVLFIGVSNQTDRS